MTLRALAGRVRRAAWQAGVVPKQAYAQRSYSQEGEDRVLARYFGNQASGFFVDVGAHHPYRFSNTQLFYDRGWRGINIDAMPGSMKPFRRARPRDLNLEVGVGATAATAKFFVFGEHALNTFDPAISEEHLGHGHELKRTVDVPVAPLSSLLAEHVPSGTAIDFMSVDVEGRDLEVLQSNDWTRFRPRFVLAEVVGSAIATLEGEPVMLFMRSVRYAPVAKTMNTIFFEDHAAAGGATA